MMKQLILQLLLLSTISLSIHSCRTDEMVTSMEQKQKERIIFFERFEKEKRLSKNVDSNNYAIPFGYSMLAYFKNYPEKKTELENKYGAVDLSVSSEDMDIDDGRKLLMFPMLKDGKVTAVIGGVINAERDYLYFDIYKEGHPDRTYLIKTFQDYYNGKAFSRNDSNNPTSVGDVIIVVKKHELKYPDPWDPTGGGHDMGGGQGDYTDGSGGNGGNNNPNSPTTNPCEQTKNKLQDPNIKKVIDDVKEQAEKAAKDINEGEIGRIEKNDGTILPADVSSDHHVTFNDISNSKGAYHNHTMTGTKIQSPPDIEALLGLTAVQPSESAYGEAYVGMIGAAKCSTCPGGIKNYHYIIRFNGTASDLKKSYTEDKMREFIKDYKKMEGELADNLSYVDFLGDNLNKKGLEKLFFETLDNMELSGKVTLQRIEDNGRVINVTLDSNKVPVEVPCS